jgi:hypothetical protein
VGEKMIKQVNVLKYGRHSTAQEANDQSPALGTERLRATWNLPTKVTHTSLSYSNFQLDGFPLLAYAPRTLTCIRTPFSNQVRVIAFDFLLNAFNRLEVLDSLDAKFSGCLFVHYNQRTRVQLQS